MTEFPATQNAIEIYGVDQVRLNTSKPVPPVGPRQILLKMEASGICFSDTKLMHAFDHHPRKSEVLGGLTSAELAEIPTYRPGSQPVVPGHEPVARIVAVGDAVTQYEVGQRVLVQTDYRHLPTASSNGSFGYNFDGALEEYSLVDERVVIDPATGERFLIQVSDAPSASAVALIEPWACVQASYAWPERQQPKAGGKALIVGDAQGADELYAVCGSVDRVTSVAEAGEGYDDIVYAGSDPDEVEALGSKLAGHGVMAIVTLGGSFGRRVKIDVGRVHYDLIRYVGTTGDDARDAYAKIPATCELRANDKVAVIGAAGPMGLMHTVRTAVSDLDGLTLDAVDVDDDRLARLAKVLGPIAEQHGLPVRVINSKNTPLEAGYTYVAVMVPVPVLLAQAIDLAGANSVVNAFAGFAIGTVAELDLDGIVSRGVYLVGTSGSRIVDMHTVLHLVEQGIVDTNISLDAVSGMAGVADAIESVNNRTSGGKIMVYPTLPDLGYVRVSEMAEKLPHVAVQLNDGLWTKAAEDSLLGR
ncbi:MAG: alcohol dehydrogenase catalytic domain-containing protein [Propionibacteriaceae bacterium]